MPTLGSFADRLTHAREKAGLSIVELAAKAGMHRQTLHKLENAERAPSLETAARIAKALGVSVDYLADE